LRGDFETEYENDAESILCELAFTEEDTTQERDLKLSLLEIYNQKLDERAKRKAFILERDLLEYKKMERKRNKEDKDIYDKTRVFARTISKHEFEEFLNGLLEERRLRKRIKELKKYRKLGVHTVVEAEEYENDRKRRESDNAAGRKSTTVVTRKWVPREPPKIEEKKHKQQKKFSAPLDISASLGYDLLSEKERELCSSLRLFPQQYMVIKDTLLRESMRQGSLMKATARQMIKIDVNKTSRIFDFFEEIGWINKVAPTKGNNLPPIYNKPNVEQPTQLNLSSEFPKLSSGLK